MPERADQPCRNELTAVPSRRARRRARNYGIGVVVAFALATAAVSPFFFQTEPRGLIRSIQPPLWLDATQNDELAYGIHAALGTALNWTGVRSAAAASEWFKAAWHAQSLAQIDAAARGLIVAQQHISTEELEASLCPFVSQKFESQMVPETSTWGSRGVQFATLLRANLSCGDPSMIVGGVPDDVPIQYSMNPPNSGLYHDSWYPTDGLSAEPLPPELWVHNLAHGQILVVYRCADGCPGVADQAQALYASLPPGRNSRGDGARMIITRYDAMNAPFAVLAWGESLMLDRLDLDQIADFYAEHVDQGTECRNLVCPP